MVKFKNYTGISSTRAKAIEEAARTYDGVTAKVYRAPPLDTTNTVAVSGNPRDLRAFDKYIGDHVMSGLSMDRAEALRAAADLLDGVSAQRFWGACYFDTESLLIEGSPNELKRFARRHVQSNLKIDAANAYADEARAQGHQAEIFRALGWNAIPSLDHNSVLVWDERR
jgi:hypothetical protein